MAGGVVVCMASEGARIRGRGVGRKTAYRRRLGFENNLPLLALKNDPHFAAADHKQAQNKQTEEPNDQRDTADGLEE